MRAITILTAAALACEGGVPRDEAVVLVPEPVGAAVEPVGGAAESIGSAMESATAWLDQYDFDDRLLRFDLPGRLNEISGLAMTADGRLFAHDDERGRVHEIDPVAGEVGKRFDLGADMVRADFEGMAILDERFFLISSRGALYEFREGVDREAVDYRVTDTGVGRDCEVEGLDYDPVDEALLIACKVSTPDRTMIVVHRLPIDPSHEPLPPMRIAKSGLEEFGFGDAFDPSAVAVSPTGTILLLSGRHDGLMEVSRSGEILAVVELSKGRHPQSEGLALGADGTLYISDERSGKEPRLTAYGQMGQEGGR